MRRREVVTFIGFTAAWPFAARGQHAGKVYRIGILEAIPEAQNASNLDGLRRGLRHLGYIEGRKRSSLR
jgi:putative ABC transport system substrate-binding protein